MKPFALALIVVMLSAGGAGSAQTAAGPSRMDMISRERSRIDSDRGRLENEFLTEDAACYKRFAVNSCLDEVNVRRRAALADLRRQEILLNDEERQIRGAEQLRKTEEKSSPEKQKEAADRREKAVQDYQGRLTQEQDKQAARAKAQADEKANAATSVTRQQANQEKAAGRVQRQSETAGEAQKFSEKQKAAAERRAKHDADAAQRTKPPSAPLPAPP